MSGGELERAPLRPPAVRKPKPLKRKAVSLDRVPLGVGQKFRPGDRPKQPPVSSVVAFSARHIDYSGKASAMVYDYAAIRASNGRWYTTGSTCPPMGYSWNEFLDFLMSLVEASGERLR